MQDAVAEFDTLVLPDKRLVKRVQSFVRLAVSNPSETLPRMLQDSAQLEGAYRLVNNSRVAFDDLLAPHVRCTGARAEQASDVVVVHDTTDIETQYADGDDVGYLSTGRSGYRAHVSLALSVEPDRPARPLGVLGLQADFRLERPNYRKKKVKKRLSSAQTARSETKTFLRWERGIQASSDALQGATSIIHVADREADSYPLFCKVLQLGDGCVFRLRNDRRARQVDDDDMMEGDWSSLAEIACGLKGAFERAVPLSKRGAKSAPRSKQQHPPREARCATLNYSAMEVELRRPHYAPAELPQSIRLWLVRVWEPEPPAGQKPVQWMLLTTEPCATAADIARIVDLYRSRWMIEDYFKVLKTLCKLEQRQFESQPALLNILALFIPIAVHLLWLRTCARDTPDRPATEAFTPLQLEVLTHLSHRKMPPNPTVLQAMWVLAGHGGHIANNGWPGTQVLARAFTRLLAESAAWKAALEAHRDVINR